MIKLYYDKDCAFCYKSVTRVLKGILVDVEVLTIQDIAQDNQFFSEIPAAELYSAMWLIDEDLSIREKGYFAFKYLYTHAHKSVLLKVLFSIPVLSDYFGTRIYQIVARNRKLAGCNSENCTVHYRSDLG